VNYRNAKWRAQARRYIFLILALGAAAPVARAEYAVLRSGQRLHITGYERAGAVVRLQMNGGWVEVAAEDILAIEPEVYFPAEPRPAPLNVPFAEVIRAAAQKHGVEQELIASVIAVESNFNPRAVSPKLARGLMQLLPEVARRFAVANVFDPEQNIDAGTQYLKELLARYDQDLALALAAYNAGPDRVEQYRGVPPYYETRNYVRRVTQDLNKRKARKPSAPRPSTTTQLPSFKTRGPSPQRAQRSAE
jgi:soluble lytic murein transglycosylase-like protein